MKKKPILKEIATARNSLGLDLYSLNDTPEQIIRTEATTNRYFRSIYELYDEMEDKDAHLFSVLQTRKNGVLAQERKISAASDNSTDLKIARFVEDTINAIPNIDLVLYNLLDAIAKGFSIAEVMWRLDPDGKVRIARILSRPQSRFLFDTGGALRLLDPLSPLSRSSARAARGDMWGSRMPERKFLVFSFNALNGNSYGKPLCAKAYWYYWFKKNNLKFWVIFNEKFGSPTVVGKYRPGTSKEERDTLLDVIESFQNDTGVTIPENMTIELLEAKRSGTINTYRDLADWCNDEISKIVLGETLTANEGRRSGSYALGKIHENVRNEYIESDAKALMNVINGQLVKWLVEFNFVDNVVSPRFEIDTSKDEELDKQVEIDARLIALGVPLPLQYFYERYKRPAPLPDERALRYDDNNLYQYHLQYGVLTINEVRATLGLPPVPWGDSLPQRTQKETGVSEEEQQTHRVDSTEPIDDVDEREVREDDIDV